MGLLVDVEGRRGVLEGVRSRLKGLRGVRGGCRLIRHRDRCGLVVRLGRFVVLGDTVRRVCALGYHCCYRLLGR